jgi:hypothetical protein
MQYTIAAEDVEMRILEMLDVIGEFSFLGRHGFISIN